MRNRFIEGEFHLYRKLTPDEVKNNKEQMERMEKDMNRFVFGFGRKFMIYEETNEIILMFGDAKDGWAVGKRELISNQ